MNQDPILLRMKKVLSCDGLVISECMLILLTNSLLLKLSGLKHYLLNSRGDRPSLNTSNKQKHKTKFIADIGRRACADWEQSHQLDQTADLTEDLGNPRSSKLAGFHGYHLLNHGYSDETLLICSHIQRVC